MKNVFIALLEGLHKCADVIEAQLFSSGTFSSIGFEFEGETYSLSISKEKKDANNND